MSWESTYAMASPDVTLLRPAHRMASVTAGLKWAPEQFPSAKIMHISDAAMDHAPAGELPSTFSKTVSTRTKVPMHSLTHLTQSSYLVVELQLPKSSGRTTLKRFAASKAP